MDQKSIQEMKKGFATAYIDGNLASNAEYIPSFISNKPEAGKKVIASLEDEMLKCDKFQISVAFVTMSGLTPLLQTFKELEKRGIPGQILTTNYLDFSEPKALKKLNELKNISLKMYDVTKISRGFHTKGYIFRRDEVYRIILGSSNMTSAALTRNIEWNTKIISTEHGEVAQEILREFDELWDSERSFEYDRFFEIYNERYNIIKKQRQIAKSEKLPSLEKYRLTPNTMQSTFIANLRKIIEADEKRALLISATGTGKTYAAAFAMRELGFKKVLFVVHRAQLAKQAMKSFQNVFDNSVSMGIVGAGRHEYDRNFVFAMVETLNRDRHLFQYMPNAFDCIILDEAHHSPANTYQRIMEYFKPKLFLGMTATPDKRDDHLEGRNVYELFHYQIAHEIRLQKAMEDDLLCPFHYFGISDITLLNEKNLRSRKLTPEAFNELTSEERVKHVIQQAEYYGYSGDRVKGLIFCSRNEECKKLSELFNEYGYRTIALSKDTPEKLREEAFERVAMDECEENDREPLDYIFSVDILNEGVDIVEVNQVIMLRPTQSPIVFIQQLGRGLRKAEGKEYVVILDFIGNYENNFLIPVALSGDRTYNSDVIRKYVISGNSTIPGASTIHFDEIARERIFESIDKITPGKFKNIIKEGYLSLKNRLGRIPYLLDFYENEEVDPLLIIREYKTYFEFVDKMEKTENVFLLTKQQKITLEYLYKTILSGVRPDELEILRLLLTRKEVTYPEIIQSCRENYSYCITNEGIDHAIEVLQGRFVKNDVELEKYSQVDILREAESSQIGRVLGYFDQINQKDFYRLINDIISVGLARYQDKYQKNDETSNPFVLYEKYTRRDVSLLMNAGKDLSSTMYGMARIGDDVFIFVTYHKEENKDEEKSYVDGKPDYADEFVDNVIFRWDAQINNRLGGKYMEKVMTARHKHLLVQKTDTENNFFYMGEFDVSDVYETEKMSNKGVMQPICKLKVCMRTAVREDLLRYLQSKMED